MSRFNTYNQVRAITGLPQKSRRVLAIGRGNAKVKPRRFHNTSDEIKTLKEAHAAGDPLPNPHNKGFYFYFLEALKALGLDRPHSVARVQSKFKELTSETDTKDADGHTFWQRWSKKEPRVESGLDWMSRFMQNVEVLQRLGGMTPYGLRLKEVGTKVLDTKGCVVDVTNGSSGDVMITLNTNSDSPINATKTRGQGETKASKPKAKKAKAKKTSKPKAKKATKAEEATTSETKEEPVTETASA